LEADVDVQTGDFQLPCKFFWGVSLFLSICEWVHWQCKSLAKGIGRAIALSLAKEGARAVPGAPRFCLKRGATGRRRCYTSEKEDGT